MMGQPTDDLNSWEILVMFQIPEGLSQDQRPMLIMKAKCQVSTAYLAITQTEINSIGSSFFFLNHFSAPIFFTPNYNFNAKIELLLLAMNFQINWFEKNWKNKIKHYFLD